MMSDVKQDIEATFECDECKSDIVIDVYNPAYIAKLQEENAALVKRWEELGEWVKFYKGTGSGNEFYRGTIKHKMQELENQA